MTQDLPEHGNYDTWAARGLQTAVSIQRPIRCASAQAGKECIQLPLKHHQRVCRKPPDRFSLNHLSALYSQIVSLTSRPSAPESSFLRKMKTVSLWNGKILLHHSHWRYHIYHHIDKTVWTCLYSNRLPRCQQLSPSLSGDPVPVGCYRSLGLRPLHLLVWLPTRFTSSKMEGNTLTIFRKIFAIETIEVRYSFIRPILVQKRHHDSWFQHRL